LLSGFLGNKQNAFISTYTLKNFCIDAISRVFLSCFLAEFAALVEKEYRELNKKAIIGKNPDFFTLIVFLSCFLAEFAALVEKRVPRTQQKTIIGKNPLFLLDFFTLIVFFILFSCRVCGISRKKSTANPAKNHNRKKPGFFTRFLFRQ
jgi:hypothetical protein